MYLFIHPRASAGHARIDLGCGNRCSVTDQHPLKTVAAVGPYGWNQKIRFCDASNHNEDGNNTTSGGVLLGSDFGAFTFESTGRGKSNGTWRTATASS